MWNKKSRPVWPEDDARERALRPGFSCASFHLHNDRT